MDLKNDNDNAEEETEKDGQIEKKEEDASVQIDDEFEPRHFDTGKVEDQKTIFGYVVRIIDLNSAEGQSQECHLSYRVDAQCPQGPAESDACECARTRLVHIVCDKSCTPQMPLRDPLRMRKNLGFPCVSRRTVRNG